MYIDNNLHCSYENILVRNRPVISVLNKRLKNLTWLVYITKNYKRCICFITPKLAFKIWLTIQKSPMKHFNIKNEF